MASGLSSTSARNKDQGTQPWDFPLGHTDRWPAICHLLLQGTKSKAPRRRRSLSVLVEDEHFSNIELNWCIPAAWWPHHVHDVRIVTSLGSANPDTTALPALDSEVGQWCPDQRNCLADHRSCQTFCYCATPTVVRPLAWTRDSAQWVKTAFRPIWPTDALLL
jgi:hypothetical protein